MNLTRKKNISSILWLIAINSFIPFSLELFLFQISDFDIYKIFNTSFNDILILLIIFLAQYLLLKRFAIHLNKIWQAIDTLKNKILFLLSVGFLSSLIYALLPSQFPFWIVLVTFGSLCTFQAFINYFVESRFLKVVFLLLFCAGINSSLIFWMHEESNAGRHIRYAQQLAEKQDTLAEQILIDLINIEKTLSNEINKNDFWEKQWINNDYLASNYSITFEENRVDSTVKFHQPLLTIDESHIPNYTIFFPEGYAISFKLNSKFRRSIYSPHQPYKKLNDLEDFHFAVIDKSKIILSNSYAFDSHILDVELPPIGKGEKIELQGFDVLAYRHSKDIFVLIGEPLSEVQIWISNFAFFFSLLLGLVLLLEIFGLLLLKKNIIVHWQEQPLQDRIQIILIGITCLLFFIITITTFYFLDQNNSVISYERLHHTSETVRDEILEEKEQYGWKLEDFTSNYLSGLSAREKFDIDFYKNDGSLIVSSFATAKNSPSPKLIDKKVISQLAENVSLILVKRQYSETSNEPYFRTYFGIFKNNQMEGVISISSFESEIGTAPYMSVMMNKLLNVYVFLLLIAWGGGLLLIGLLTKPLELLANRLSNFKLGKQNEKLAWKGDDAIGQLISEYNKMVDKVEVTTKELIRSEREGAWQIMAQQIAHEINNKLTPLRLNIQFLTRIVNEMNSGESESVQRITTGLIDKVDGLSKIASQFKLFAKLETPEVKPIELKTFLESFFHNYTQQEEHQYDLNIDAGKEQNLIINIDDQHLKEVLNNVISNAENSIPEDRIGKINIHLTVSNNCAVIEIEDNGIGIDPAIMENIFDPKFSVTSSQTGLGLPICKRIIEFYRGQIEFITKQDVGTSFVIIFPLGPFL